MSLPKLPRKPQTALTGIGQYDAMLAELVDLLESARRASARAVNAVITATYWQIGRRIVEAEQGGQQKARYGERLIERLSTDLTARFGRGFGYVNLTQMRRFYLGWPAVGILQTPSEESKPETKRRVTSKLQTSSEVFPLPWSHYVSLLSVESEYARKFYETEALRGGWTVKQLERQIGSQFYERTALSRNKAAMLTKHSRPQREDLLTAEEEVKDPFVLEFLGLKDEYSEAQIEEALILHLQTFLLELGGDFTFVGRQRRLRVGDTWYRMDLIFFHRRLRCLVIIDLKTDTFTHADAGQMHLYCNYAREHWMLPDENPPVGLILCAKKDASVGRGWRRQYVFKYRQLIKKALAEAGYHPPAQRKIEAPPEIEAIGRAAACIYGACQRTPQASYIEIARRLGCQRSHVRWAMQKFAEAGVPWAVEFVTNNTLGPRPRADGSSPELLPVVGLVA